MEWQRDGLGVPDEVIDATREYESEQDTFSMFLERNACASQCAVLSLHFIVNTKRGPRSMGRRRQSQNLRLSDERTWLRQVENQGRPLYPASDCVPMTITTARRRRNPCRGNRGSITMTMERKFDATRHPSSCNAFRFSKCW